MLFIGLNTERISKYIAEFKFKIKDLGNVTKFLNIDINYDHDKRPLKLSQQDYIESALQELNLENCNPMLTPMEAGVKLKTSCLRYNFKYINTYPTLEIFTYADYSADLNDRKSASGILIRLQGNTFYYFSVWA